MGTGRRTIYFGLALWMASSCPAATIFVDGRVSACGDGQTWASAYKHLQDALTAARNSGGTITEIWVAAGTYQPDRDCAHPTGSGGRTCTFNLVSGVALRGGFRGTEDPTQFTPSDRDLGANRTILSGDLRGGGPSGPIGDDAKHVVTCTAVDSRTTLDGFTITLGYADSALDDSGAGFLNKNGSPTILNCRFLNNTANGPGSGMYSSGGAPKLVNCVFYKNYASAGGAVYVASGTPALINCTVSNNSVGTASGVVLAGGIQCVSNSPCSLVNCIVWANADPQVAGPAAITYSCIQGGWAGDGNIVADPRMIFVSGGDFRLRRGSPCIDAGDGAALPPGISCDLDGQARQVDDPDTRDSGRPGSAGTGPIDIGAHEYHFSPKRRLYVKANAPNDGDGGSWSTPLAHLADAFRLAQADPAVVEIWVASGTYRPDRCALQPGGSADRASSFDVPGAVSIVGGFYGEPGTEEDVSARNPATQKTILSGDLAADDGPNWSNNGENSYHVLRATGVGDGTVLDGFVITGGNANGSNDQSGSILLLQNGKLELVNCALLSNSASYATLSSGGSDLTMMNCVMAGNAGGLGASGTVTLVNCTYAGNSSGLSPHASTSGGISCSGGGRLNVRNSILWGNDGSPIVSSTGCTVEVSYSCVQGGWTGVGNIGTDPKLTSVELQSFGLRPGSPCIDAGNNDVLPSGVGKDLAYGNRFLDDPRTADTGVRGTSRDAIADMGAYEYIPIEPRRLYVSVNAPPDGDGASWGTAFKHLADAFAAAHVDLRVTEIWVAGGVYKPDRDSAHPSGSADRRATFQLPDGVAVYGGFPGQPGQEDDSAVRDPIAFPTLLSGDLAGNDGPDFANFNENSYHVVKADGLGPSSILNGFSISGGNANTALPDTRGGGIYLSSSSNTVRNCRFFANAAVPSGNSTNYRGWGGALYAQYGSPTITDCTFIANNTSGSGGAVGLYQSNMTLVNCSFSGNSTVYTGGALYNWGSSPALINCTFIDNKVLDVVYGTGGAVYNEGGSPTLTNCTLVNNWVYNLSNSNAAIYGGTPKITNCILWGNRGRQIGAYGSTPAVVTYSCVQGGYAGTGNINAEPDLLADGRLRRGSPCVDAGSNAELNESFASDLAGHPRWVDDPDTADTGVAGSPPRPVIDMGAYEYQPAAVKRLYVKADAPAGGDGLNWSSAYKHLQDALLATDPGVTEIWVAAGVYRPDRDRDHPSGTGDRGAAFRLLAGLSIYGGFPGQPGQEGDLSVRNPDLFPTILSGDLAENDGPDFSNFSENSYHVVTANAITSAVLDGVTISHGNADSRTTPYDTGGGLYCYQSSFTVNKCVFTNNRAYGEWGAGKGGGLFCAEGGPVLTNCSFLGNFGSTAGGAYISNSSPKFVGCVFKGNSAQYSGMAIYTSQASPDLLQCILADNAGPATAAMYADGGSPKLTACRIATNAGCGIYNNTSSTPRLVNCHVVGNLTTGVYNNNSSATLINCTVTDNGTGMTQSAGVSTIINSVVWGNADAQIAQSYGTVNATYCCVQGGWTGLGNVAADPMLLSNGRLHSGSSCIDAGDNTSAPSDITTDLLGGPRYVDDPASVNVGNPGGISTSPIDIGAYEYQPVPSRRVYVNANAPAGGNGSSWASAYRFLQDALTLDDPGLNEIWVAGGVYKPDADATHPNGTKVQAASFRISSGVTLQGGFPGLRGQEGDLSVRDPAAHPSVLNGDLLGDDEPNKTNRIDNSYRVVFANGVGSTAVLDGFVIRGGWATGPQPQSKGAGLHLAVSSPRILNCRIEDNHAPGGWSGNYGWYGFGGGIYNASGNPVLTNCSLSGNSSTDGGGGGIYNTGGSPKLINCSFDKNVAPTGAGLFNKGDVTLTNCSFTDGQAYAATGLYNEGNANLVNCIFLRNIASNSSGSAGAGAYSRTGTLNVTNCTFTANSAPGGSGIYIDSGNLTVNNSILWGNTGSALAVSSGSATVSYSCVQGWAAGTGNVNADPMLLADGRLRRGSPCIDAGNNALLGVDDTDAAGRLRFVDDPDTADTGLAGDPPRAIADLGALEYEPVSARRLYVNINQPAGGDGRSWTTAFKYLQTALQLPDPGVVEVWVAQGTYKPDCDEAHPDGTRDTAATFKLSSGLSILGGFPGLPGQEDTTSVRDPSSYVTVLSGDLAGNDGDNFSNFEENSKAVVTADAVSSKAVLDGVVISGAKRDILGGTQSGYGLYAPNVASPTLSHCAIVANGGWGIYNLGGSPQLTNCTITGNGSIGIYNQTGTPTLVNSIVWGNLGSAISGSVAATYSCIQTAVPGIGNINTDPLLLKNGRVRRGSPCIDAASNSALISKAQPSSLGDWRFIDDPETSDTGDAGNPPRPVADMGAFEYSPVPARTLYVNGDAAPGGNGQTWQTAFPYFQDALNAALVDPSVKEIWVAGGIYKPDRDGTHPNGTADQKATFRLLSGIVVYGGFPGLPGQEGDRSLRSPGQYRSVLSGDLAGNDTADTTSYADNSLCVVRADNLSSASALDGFTIAGGYTPDNVYYPPSDSGTAMTIIGGNPGVRNCVFTGNFANYGAGLLIAGTPTVVNCVFIANYCGPLYSGVVKTTGQGASLINCTIVGNTGRGVYCYWSTLTNCIVWGNTSNEYYGYSTVRNSCTQIAVGTGNIQTDPKLLSDGRLRRGSPCIDAGDNTAVPGDIVQDANGCVRFVDDPSTPDSGIPGIPAKAVVDMGAYEYNPGQAKRLYVKQAAEPGNAGQDWSRAHRFLQDALAAAQADPDVTEIWVAAGEYKPDRDQFAPNGTGDRHAVFRLSIGIPLYGGFSGEPGTEGDFSSRSPAAFPSILAGDLAGNDGANIAGNDENSYHVLAAENVSSGAVLDGFIITGGNANGASGDDFGGGMYSVGGSVTIKGCVFKNNAATLGGAGLYATTGNPTLLNCIFTGNAASDNGYGGAIYAVDNSKPAITNCTFYGNSAGYSGAVHSLNANPQVKNSILWGNTSKLNAPTQIGGSAGVSYSCVQGGFIGGSGNINLDPLFVAAPGDLHLTGLSPCIDTGDYASDYSLEPEPDGARINMGAYGNTPEAATKGSLAVVSYNQVSRRRVSRTRFEYKYSLTMRNAGALNATQVTAYIATTPPNVTRTRDSAVYFPSIAAQSTSVSGDTFTIIVDRTTLVSAVAISWGVSSSFGTQVMTTFLPISQTAPGDFNSDGFVDAGDAFVFQACMTGPGLFYDAKKLPEGCSFTSESGEFIPADFDSDHDVDQEDFGTFQTYLGLTEPVAEP